MKNLPIIERRGLPEISRETQTNQFNNQQILAENPHRDLGQPKKNTWTNRETRPRVS